MDHRRNELLAEMARDAALERSDFLVRAGEQLERFLRDQAGRRGPRRGRAPPARGADRWAAGQPEVPVVDDEASAAAALYGLALDFQERSQRAEGGVIAQFENAASALMGQVG